MRLTAHSSRSKAAQTPETRVKKRRPQRAALFCSLLLLALAAFLWLNYWPATVRREAYLPELEAMAKRSPYDGPLQALTGARQIEARDYAAATVSLRQAIAADEAQPEVWLNLCAAFDANDERPQALAHLKLALQNSPDDGLLQAALARVAQIAVPAPPGALAPAFAPNGPQIIIDNTTQGSFLNGAAQWWGRRNPAKSGFTTRQLWAAKEPRSALAQRLWGEALLRNRRPQEAVDILREAIALAPQASASHLSLARAQEDLGQSAAASLEYVEALKIERDSLPALLGLGRTLQKNGRLGSAVRSFRRATEIAPTLLEAWTALGRVTHLTGVGYAQSAEAYAKAVQLAPDNTEFFNDYATSLYRASRQQDAEKIVRQRLKAAPDDALSHYLLGMMLMNFNPTPERIDEAEKHTREALKLNEGNPLASVQLAQLLFEENKNREEAIGLLKNSIRLDPYNRNSQLLLARLYRRNGQKALADQTAAAAATLFKNQQTIADLEEQERDDTLNPPQRQKLIQLYELTGQNAKAQRQRTLIALLKTDPQAPAQKQEAYTKAIDGALGKPQSAIEEN